MFSLLESIGLVAALHGFTEGQTGLVFLAIVFAAVLGQLTNSIQNRLYMRNVARKGPEARLYLAMGSAVAFPVGCFIYGWTSYSDVSIAGPIVGIVILMWGVHGVYLAVFNYLADSYLVSRSVNARTQPRSLLTLDPGNCRPTLPQPSPRNPSRVTSSQWRSPFSPSKSTRAT